MNIEELRDYCLSLPHATEDIPFGKQGYDDDVAFRVAGKIFAFLCADGSNLVVLKCDPDQALDLRDRYIGAIEPAFHCKKIISLWPTKRKYQSTSIALSA